MEKNTIINAIGLGAFIGIIAPLIILSIIGLMDKTKRTAYLSIILYSISASFLVLFVSTAFSESGHQHPTYNNSIEHAIQPIDSPFGDDIYIEYQENSPPLEILELLLNEHSDDYGKYELLTTNNNSIEFTTQARNIEITKIENKSIEPIVIIKEPHYDKKLFNIFEFDATLSEDTYYEIYVPYSKL